MGGIESPGQSEFSQWEAETRRIWAEIQELSGAERADQVSRLAAGMTRLILRRAERASGQIFTEDERLYAAAQVGGAFAVADAAGDDIEDIVQLARQSYERVAGMRSATE